jgi:hypothetical protein
MIHVRTILVTALLGATALVTACTGNPRLSLFTSSGNPHTLVCPEGTVEYCERISAFVWGKCDCAAVSL